MYAMVWRHGKWHFEHVNQGRLTGKYLLAGNKKPLCIESGWFYLGSSWCSWAFFIARKTLSLRLCCIELVLSYGIAVFMFWGSSRRYYREADWLLNITR